MPSTVEANATATAVNAAIQIATTTTRRHRRGGAPNSGRERLRIGGQPIYPPGRRHRQQRGTFGRWNASHSHGYTLAPREPAAKRDLHAGTDSPWLPETGSVATTDVQNDARGQHGNTCCEGSSPCTATSACDHGADGIGSEPSDPQPGSSPISSNARKNGSAARPASTTSTPVTMAARAALRARTGTGPGRSSKYIGASTRA